MTDDQAHAARLERFYQAIRPSSTTDEEAMEMAVLFTDHCDRMAAWDTFAAGCRVFRDGAAGLGVAFPEFAKAAGLLVEMCDGMLDTDPAEMEQEVLSWLDELPVTEP